MMELFTNRSKSFLKPWRVGIRNSKSASSIDLTGSTPSASQTLNEGTQATLAPAVKTRNDTLGNDTSQVVPVDSSIAPPPEQKDQCKLCSLHDTSNTNISHSPGQFPIDIIAVHGLDGGAHKTWTHPNGHYWLQDSLPKDFPGSRIYSFGYPAAVLFTRGNAGITEFATALLEEIKAERKTREQQLRPLIFICHSMGGIVVKKAFNISVFEPRYTPILTEAKAILFFATPHRGSDYADFFSKLAQVMNVPLIATSRFSGKTNVELIKSLSSQSRELSEIAVQFRHKTKDLTFFSFTEDYPTPPLKHKVVEPMSGRLDVDTETPITMLGCDHRTICRFSGPKDKDENYKKVYNKLEEIAVSVTAKYEATLREEDEPCLHSLSYQSITSRALETNLATTHPKTCSWILTHPSFLSWSSSTRTPHLPSHPSQSQPQPLNPNLLWIKGHPGTGKSTILSFLVHTTTSLPTFICPSPSKAPIILSFFFHGTGSALQKSLLGFFRSLLHQIYTQSFFARKKILAFYVQKCKENGICGRDWEWGVSELRSLFGEIVEEFRGMGDRGIEMVIFVDALDEAVLGDGEKAAGELVGYLKALCAGREEGKGEGGGEARVRICVSSRHYPVIATMDGLVINVEDENSSDIKAFVSHKLRTEVVGWEMEKDEEKKEFEKAFVEKADGVFLWARERIKRIVKGLNDGVFSLKNIREMVELETNELSALYENVLLTDVDEGLRSLSLIMLRWLCLAERPLTLVELRYTMACDMLHDKIFEEDIEYEEVKPIVEDDARMEKMVKSLSGGLAEVRYCGSEGTVQVFHQSVRDFLYDSGLAMLHSYTDLANGGAVKDVIGVFEDIVAKSCLRYLRCGEISERAAVWMTDIEQTYTFTNYATLNWAVHAGNAERLGIGQEYIVQYSASGSGLLETWRLIYRAVAYRHPRCPGPLASLIHIASIFNLETTAVHSLKQGAALEDEDDINGCTPLGLAARHGHSQLVRRYIGLGARINAREGPPPVELAAASGQISTVRLLLQNGAILGEKPGLDSALGEAAEKGNVKLMQVLIEAGADINQTRETHGSVLAVAAYKGQLDAVKVLVRNGADVDMKGGYHGCPLQAAICGPKESREPLVDYFLRRNVDVNSHGGEFGYPLQAAAFMGKIGIVKSLLSKGAKINALGGKYGTALQAAVLYHQGLEIVQLLLSYGADVNAQIGEYGNALQGACAKGNEEVAELLIHAGANVNVKGGHFGNALQAAVTYPEGGGIVALLLKHGARVESQCGYYGNVLQAAISVGNETLAKQFLGEGLDINETGGHYGDNLQAAFPSCQDSFVQYLLDRGANVSPAPGGEEGSPLRAAVFWNRPSMVKLFLERGADPNERIEGFSGTPLHIAARRGYSLNGTAKKANLEIVRFLLDFGADIGARLSSGDTPIELAIVSGHKAAVQLLLSRGASLKVSQGKKRAIEKLLELE